MVICKGSHLTPRVGQELADFCADEPVDFNQPPDLSVALLLLGCLVNKLLCFWWWWGRDTSKKVGLGGFCFLASQNICKRIGTGY